MQTDHEKAMDLLAELEAYQRQAIADIRACLDAVGERPLADSLNVKPEPMATADTFAAGDWIRPTGNPRWFQISGVGFCWCPNHSLPHVRVELVGNNASLHLKRFDTLSYLTDEQMAAVPCPCGLDKDHTTPCADDVPTTRDEAADDALLRAEVMAERDEEAA